MFVRWKRRQRKGKKTVLVAVLLRSERTSAGPRQKHVCYIGSIREERIAKVDQYGFWWLADRNLARAGVTGENLKAVINSLTKVVPRQPGDTDAEAARRLAECERLAKVKRPMPPEAVVLYEYLTDTLDQFVAEGPEISAETVRDVLNDMAKSYVERLRHDLEVDAEDDTDEDAETEAGSLGQCRSRRPDDNEEHD